MAGLAMDFTPDMDADALAGVINISTRRPVGAAREMDVRIGGGITPRYVEHTGPGARAAISYGDSPNDEFSYAVNFSYQLSPNINENLDLNWDTRNFGDGPVTIMSQLSTDLNFDSRERYGAGLQMTFQPTDRSTYHIQGVLNVQNREEVRYGVDFLPRTTAFINQNETAGRELGTTLNYLRYNARVSPHRTDQYTFRASPRHLLAGFDMDYMLGWGHGRFDRNRYRFRFNSPRRYDWYFDFEDRMHPTIEFIGGRFEDYPTAQEFAMSWAENIWDEHSDNELSAEVNFEVPFTRGSIKFGSSTRMTLKNGLHADYRMYYQRNVNITQFERQLNADWNLLGRDHLTYHIPWFMDMHSGRDFFHSQYVHMALGKERWAESRETQSFRMLRWYTD